MTGPTPAQQRLAGRVAAVLVGLEVLAIIAIAGFYLVELSLGLGSDQLVVIMSVVTMAVFAVGLGYVAAGLWHRHPRAQAPAIAFNALLVPLGIAMFQFAPPLMAGGVLLVAVVIIAGALLLGRLD